MEITETEKLQLLMTLSDSLRSDDNGYPFTLNQKGREDLWVEILNRNHKLEFKRINGIDDNDKSTQSK